MRPGSCSFSIVGSRPPMSVNAWQTRWSKEAKREVVALLGHHWTRVEPDQPDLVGAYTSQAKLVGQRRGAGCTASLAGRSYHLVHALGPDALTTIPQWPPTPAPTAAPTMTPPSPQASSLSFRGTHHGDPDKDGAQRPRAVHSFAVAHSIRKGLGVTDRR